MPDERGLILGILERTRFSVPWEERVVTVKTTAGSTLRLEGMVDTSNMLSLWQRA